MTTDQTTIFAILAGIFVLFVWGRWRHDVVAFMALLAAVVTGVVPFSEAFLGFGHPATVTVAMVLILSRGLSNSGAVEIVASLVARAAGRLSVHVASLAGVAAALSAVMNNVGALALLMPVAVQSAAKRERSPAALLMPLSFGSILGGLVTLIGTPPNVIVATYRDKAIGAPFAMFDFTPVGAPVAIAGVAFVALIGWRLIPRERRTRLAPQELFDLKDYVSELRVPAESPAIGEPMRELENAVEGAEAVIVGVTRKDRRIYHLRHERIQEGDVLVIEAGPEDIDKFVTKLQLELVGTEGPTSELLRSDEVALMEAVVVPGSRIDGRSAGALRLRSRHGVNLLAVSRQGQPIRQRLRQLRIRAGDVLLLQGENERLPGVIASLGCLPLAERGIQIGRRRQAGLCVAVFAAAIAGAALGVVPIPIALALGAIAVVLLNIVPPREIYESVDWPVILVLGAMIPIGEAIETTGGTRVIAGALLDLAAGYTPVVILALLMIVTMTLSDIMNNAATAVVTAPIAVVMAGQLGVNADAFLMAVAIGASCAFLTPIGHQNNMLIMGPGGYHFGDYWRMGLPLEILIVCIAVPMILWVWPL